MAIRERELVYANCWEDSDVALEALDVRPGKNYLVVASAGDIALAMLSRNPAHVHAVDINPAQVACIEVKAAGFKKLDHARLTAFLGVTRAGAGTRLEAYDRLKNSLSGKSRAFWDAHRRAIAGGVIHAGAVEKKFRWLRRVFLPLLIPRSMRTAAIPSAHQIENMLSSRRWNIFLRTFFNRSLTGRVALGRRRIAESPLAGADIPSVVRSRLGKTLKNHLGGNGGNIFFDYITTGRFRTGLPYYLRPEVHALIARNLHALHFRHAGVRQDLEESRVKFDGIYLSDIFDYMTLAEFESTLALCRHASARGARVVYWNNLLEYRHAGGDLVPLPGLAEKLSGRNQAFFYGSLAILEKQ